MGFAAQHAVVIETQECCTCGVVFGLPRSLDAKLQRDGGWFYCPNGHRQHYSEPEVEKLRKELEAERKRKLDALSQANTLRVERDKLQRERKRVQNGVCPCCNRSFTNLRRHMATKHPDQK